MIGSGPIILHMAGQLQCRDVEYAHLIVSWKWLLFLWLLVKPFSCRLSVVADRGHENGFTHYDDVIMTTIASQITSLTSVYSTVYSDADQRKHQTSASLAFVVGIHKGPVTRKRFLFDDVIMRFWHGHVFERTDGYIPCFFIHFEATLLWMTALL